MKNKFSALRAQMPPDSQVRAEAKVSALLDALARDIDNRPEIVQPVNADLVDRLRSLTAGVEVDLDQPLPSPGLTTRARPERCAWLLP